jgi:L-gulono-1,4-lactone dehydrogenase
MDPRLKTISKTRKIWRNATRNVKVAPIRFFTPETLSDIKLIIKDAESKGFTVRAVGSGHSFSEVAKSNDYLLKMTSLNKIENIDPLFIKEKYRSNGPQQRYFVKTEAGITIKALNKKLDQMGLALKNMGAVNYQTVSGALSTATHGSGIKMPTFPDMVHSIYLVTSGGEYLQVEPSDGITDPHDFIPTQGEKLIQDDDIFYSLLVSFGAMGIIYAITFEVVPAFIIKEERIMMNWSELKDEILVRDFINNKVRRYDYVSFRVNPFKVKGHHLCSVVFQEILPGKPKLSMNAKFKNLKSVIFGNLPFVSWFMIRYLNINPKSIPGAINGFLKGTKDKLFIGKSYRTLFQSGANIRRHGLSSEFAFPVDAKKIVQIIETIMEQAIKNAEIGNIYQSSHIPVRFVPPSKAYLSPAYNKETVYIDIPLLQKTIGDYEILDRYQDLIVKEGGIPHWGKINNKLYGRYELIRNFYPKLDTWKEIRQKLDPKRTFVSDFMEKANLC